MSQGKWQNTYAATDEKEYWAIGVQGMIWFQNPPSYGRLSRLCDVDNIYANVWSPK